MAHVTRQIGLSLGADICWPICFEEILKRLKLSIPWQGDTLDFAVSRVTIEPFDLRAARALRPRDRPADALVSHQPRMDQEGGRAR